MTTAAVPVIIALSSPRVRFSSTSRSLVPPSLHPPACPRLPALLDGPPNVIRGRLKSLRPASSYARRVGSTSPFAFVPTSAVMVGSQVAVQFSLARSLRQRSLACKIHFELLSKHSTLTVNPFLIAHNRRLMQDERDDVKFTTT